jgi:hypothetical protein
MKIKSFGCSFIYGSDLADDGHGFLVAEPSRLTWPSLLAQNLNCTYECYARPGSGNLRTLEKVLTQTSLNDPGIFVIGWTWIDRFDYTTIPTELMSQSDFIDNEAWKTIMPMDTDNRAHNYYRDLHSQYRDKLTNLIYIKTAIDALKQNNISFIMTYIDELLFETQWQCTTVVKDLQNYIRPHMTTFEDSTFLDWSTKNGFPVSEKLHPLEPAHRAAADYMIKIFDTQKTNVPVQPARV